MDERLFHFGLFRHGETNYRQGNREVSLAEADDLKPEAIPTIQRNALAFAEDLAGERIMIRSSPMGRALHTAKVIADSLEGRCTVLGIAEDRRLREVDRFDWRLYSSLVGTLSEPIVWEGKSLTIDTSKTNPLGLSNQTYFFRDCIHRLPEEVLHHLPASFVERILEFEKHVSISARILDFFRDVSEPMDTHEIAVTHEAAAYRLLDRFSRGKVHALDRGHYLHLEKRNSGLYLVKAPGVDERYPFNILASD